MAITLNGTTGITTPDITSAGSLNIDASAPDNSLVVNSAGNVGIGTSSPDTLLNIQGVTPTLLIQDSDEAGDGFIKFQTANGTQRSFIQTAMTANVMLLGTGTTEAMRIDSSGNLMVGNAGQVWDERLLVSRSTNAVVGGFYSSSASYTSSVIRAQTETAAGTGWYFFEGRAAGGSFQYGIRGNGTVATSDVRRKKNIEPARSYLQDVCSIPIVKYNWKTDEDGAPKELGWLAQDVEKVFPNMVVTHHDGPNDDQEVLLLKKEVFLPMLMKCIQEQQATITLLTARIEALEQV